MNAERWRANADDFALVIGALGFSLAWAFGARTPAFQAPDEPAHLAYTFQVSEGQLPEIAVGDWDQDAIEAEVSSRFERFVPFVGGDSPDNGPSAAEQYRGLSYEDHQPPLFYATVPVGMVLAMMTHADRNFGRVSHTSVAIAEARFWSMLLMVLTLSLAYRALRLGWPTHTRVPLAATAFIAFLPMFAYMSAVVNNDALAGAVMALALLAAVRRLAGRTTRRRYVAWSGLIWATALLTKLTVYPVILPLAAAEWLRTRREGGRMRDVAAPVARSMALGLLVAAPWFIRNMRVYGLTDPFGLAAHDRVVVGQPRTADWIAQHGWGGYLERAVVFTFDSFWGVFGWMSAFMDRRIYIVLALASAVMAIGFAGYVRRAWLAGRGGRGGGIAGVDAGGLGGGIGRADDIDAAADVGFTSTDVGPLQRDVLVVFGLVVATTVGGYVWYNLTFVQHQGRYLFPALIPIACAAMLGIREWGRWLARAIRRPAWSEPLALAGMAAFDGGLLATSVWALIHVIPTLWPGR